MTSSSGAAIASMRPPAWDFPALAYCVMLISHQQRLAAGRPVAARAARRSHACPGNQINVVPGLSPGVPLPARFLQNVSRKIERPFTWLTR
jgi:hypothetical protein